MAFSGGEMSVRKCSGAGAVSVLAGGKPPCGAGSGVVAPPVSPADVVAGGAVCAGSFFAGGEALPQPEKHSAAKTTNTASIKMLFARLIIVYPRSRLAEPRHISLWGSM